MVEMNNFKIGLRDGVAVGIGYVAVSFAFGLLAVSAGLGPLEALLVSMLNLTSAGQIAALPALAGGSLVELVLGQAVINSRYALMSVSLSQRLAPSVGLRHRLLIGFINTDEIFALSMSKGEALGPRYFYGLAISPIIGWSLGTVLGAIAGSLLPAGLVAALSVAMYAMFVAILVPASMDNRATLIAVLLSAALSSAFYYLPSLSSVPSGFTVIIIAVAVGVVMSLVAPIKDAEEVQNA